MAEESRTTVAVAAYLLNGCRRAVGLARTATGDLHFLVEGVRERGDGRGGPSRVEDGLPAPDGEAPDEPGPADDGGVLADQDMPVMARGALCDDVDLGPHQMLGTIAQRLGCEAASSRAVHAASD
jgi:hypothetical protein